MNQLKKYYGIMLKTIAMQNTQTSDDISMAIAHQALVNYQQTLLSQRLMQIVTSIDRRAIMNEPSTSVVSQPSLLLPIVTTHTETTIAHHSVPIISLFPVFAL